MGGSTVYNYVNQLLAELCGDLVACIIMYVALCAMYHCPVAEESTVNLEILVYN